MSPVRRSKPIRTPRCAYIVVLRWRRPPLRHSLYRPRGPLPLRLPPPRLRRDLPLVPRFPLSRLIRPLWGNSHKRRPRLRLMARRPMELLPHRVIPNTVSTADGRWPRELRYVWAAACRWVRVPASAPIAASRPIPWPRSASIAAAISTTPPIRSRGAKPRWRPGLLGIFLGSLGVHNFYLGYTGKAVAQLLLSIIGVFACGIGPIAGLDLGAGRGYPNSHRQYPHRCKRTPPQRLTDRFRFCRFTSRAFVSKRPGISSTEYRGVLVCTVAREGGTTTLSHPLFPHGGAVRKRGCPHMLLEHARQIGALPGTRIPLRSPPERGR